MTTLVEGRRHPDRSITPDTFADITDATFTLCAGGIEFDGDLTTQQQTAIHDRMTSRDDADQAVRANLSDLLTNDTTASPLAKAVAAYLLGGAQ